MPAGRQHRVRVVAAPLADTEHLHAALRELDRSPQTGRPRADHEHPGSDAPLRDVICHGESRRSRRLAAAIMSARRPFAACTRGRSSTAI